MVCKVCGSKENVKDGRCGVCYDLRMARLAGCGCHYGAYVARFGNGAARKKPKGMRICVVCGTMFEPKRSNQICCCKACSEARKAGL